MKVIDIRNLEKIYNESEIEVHAIRGIDLSFEEGEFAAVVGPSGSGKTTLLNMIGGLDRPSSGEIHIMHLQGRSKAEREKRTRELLEAVGLIDRMNSRPSKLSGGQQQRVAVARALASKPKFILADEPTANLDSVSAGNLLDIMEKLNKEENITFIFSTHDPRVVKKARRVVTLEDGKVISDELKN
jgi:putative ABC transport system ATP-binding protein